MGFGIELECYLPEGTTMAQAANAVQQRLGAPVHVEGYNHHLRSYWKVVTDGSLGDVARGIEFVSPVLEGADGLAQVAKVCNALTDFGCTVNKKCGLHVHVGVGAPAMSFFRNIVKLYSMYEPVIDSMLPVSRRGSANMYCRSMTAASAARIDAAVSVADLIRVVSGTQSGESRYFKLNLAAYARHRTVEFRQHSGTLDATKACRWVSICQRMVAVAMRSTFSVGGPAVVRNQARPGTKTHRIGEMMLRPEGVTGTEVCREMAWPSVSMPAQARMCGLEFTTQRTGRETRYFARVAVSATPVASITVSGFASFIGADDAERAYMQQRAADLSGAVAWAA